MSPRTASALLIAMVASFTVGCADDPPAGPDPSADPPGYTDPTALINAHAAALIAQDYAKYDKLLAEDFEYFPQSEDLIDFPWLQGRISWARADELQMIAHMFDDNFQPANPQAVGTVDTINAEIAVVGQRTDSDGSTLVDAQAVMTVIFATGNGASADLRFEFRLVTAADGYLRIRSIREQPPYLRAVDPTSWAGVKSLYRDAVVR